MRNSITRWIVVPGPVKAITALVSAAAMVELSACEVDTAKSDDALKVAAALAAVSVIETAGTFVRAAKGKWSRTATANTIIDATGLGVAAYFWKNRERIFLGRAA